MKGKTNKMANVTFHRSATAVNTEGAITFKTSGGITVGTGSAATEYASKVTLDNDNTDSCGIYINGVYYPLWTVTESVPTSPTPGVLYLIVE